MRPKHLLGINFLPRQVTWTVSTVKICKGLSFGSPSCLILFKPASGLGAEKSRASLKRTHCGQQFMHACGSQSFLLYSQASKGLPLQDTLKLLEKCSCHRNTSLETIFKVKQDWVTYMGLFFRTLIHMHLVSCQKHSSRQDTNRANHRTEDCLSRPRACRRCTLGV